MSFSSVWAKSEEESWLVLRGNTHTNTHCDINTQVAAGAILTPPAAAAPHFLPKNQHEVRRGEKVTVAAALVDLPPQSRPE